MSKKSKEHGNNIITNRKAFHDYFLEEHFEAGIALMGWEVKALRAGRVQIKESHILVKDREIYLFGAYITPLPAASTHVIADPSRTRKLLLHGREIAKLIGATATPSSPSTSTGKTATSKSTSPSPKAKKPSTNAPAKKTATGRGKKSAS